MLPKDWAKSLLKRMKFVEKKKQPQPATAEVCLKILMHFEKNFSSKLRQWLTMKEIPPKLVTNWDQTGLIVIMDHGLERTDHDV